MLCYFGHTTGEENQIGQITYILILGPNFVTHRTAARVNFVYFGFVNVLPELVSKRVDFV